MKQPPVGATFVAALVTLVALTFAVPAQASTSNNLYFRQADCWGTTWHTHTGSSTFSIGTYQDASYPCQRVKVQGNYWSESTGVVTTSEYYSSSAVNKSFSAQSHYWSKGTLCQPTTTQCQSATLY
jgi:hypothetical protein